MIKALFTSATGMNAQATVIDNTSNNLANVNTNGFKKGQADFQDLIYVNERTPGAEAAQGLQAPTGLQIGSGARVAGITKVFSQGSLVNTQNPLLPGASETVHLDWTLPPMSGNGPFQIYVIVDDAGKPDSGIVNECDETNNKSLPQMLSCKQVG